MLRPVTLVDQWRAIERGLPEDWSDARLELTVADDSRAERAAALLGPANPGRSRRRIRFFVARRGVGVSPDNVRRLVGRLDAEGIAGELRLVASDNAPAEPATSRRTLAESWDAALGVLPSDWSDLYCELELASTDYLERAALLVAPLNPARYGGKPAFRFRCARSFGYGASPGMVRRCLERCDADGIRGEVRVLRALSDTHPVSTQGPVWYVGGRAV
jgi:hypothetical protein